MALVPVMNHAKFANCGSETLLARALYALSQKLMFASVNMHQFILSNDPDHAPYIDHTVYGNVD